MDVETTEIKQKKRLVGVIHALEVGGAERMMVTILNHFVAESFDVHLIVFDNKGELKKELSQAISVHDLGIPSVMKGMPKCLKALHSIKADIVFTGIGHVNIALSPFIPFMKRILPKTKWIVRETSIVSLQNQTSKYPKLFDFLYRHSYKNYEVIITQSEDMKKDLEENYFKSSKIITINNPINHEHVKRLANEKDILSFDERKINLLTVARLREEKRHDLMLETLYLLPKEYHLTIVGSGEKELELKELTQKLNLVDRVSFEGYKSNPYPYMKKADLFVLTSQREGFPNVLLEANVLGVPIVAFICMGGIKEIIEDRKNGLYTTFGECQLLAEKIMEANSLDFNKNEISETIISKFSQEIILKKYKEIFLK